MTNPPHGPAQDGKQFSGAVRETSVRIVNRLGLHARATSRFVSLAKRFQSDVELERDGRCVNGKGIMSLMLLEAGPGTRLTLRCRGADSAAALAELEALIARGFDEDQDHG
ncbi:MAG: HPr family phosphocarrier protein [Pseudomonadota bacterium]